MARTIVTFPDALLVRIKAIAEEEGVSMAELIRDTMKERVEKRPPKPRAIGMFESPGKGKTHLGRESADFEFEPPAWR